MYAKKKHFTVIMLSALLAFCLCACGKGGITAGKVPAGSAAAEEAVSESAAAGYTFHTVNADGQPVAGVRLQVCSDRACQMLTTDEAGTAVFTGEPGEYEIHVAQVPEGYVYDADEVYVTGKEPEEKTLVLKKAEAETDGDRVTFSAADINGNAIDSSIFADYDVTLVNIWEPWCPPCVSEMPEFEAFYEKCKEEGIKFNIIGFYTTDEDAMKTVEELGITYPIAKDEGFFEDYQTGYVPTNFFVDSHGQVLPITKEEMTPMYQQLIEQDISGYEAGDRSSLDEATYNYLKEAQENGKLEELAAEYAAESVYEKGQTNSLTGEMLEQFVKNRLP